MAFVGHRDRAVAEGPDARVNLLGMTLALQFLASFGFILPVNSRQRMVAQGTGTFAARDFIRTGTAITALACLC